MGKRAQAILDQTSQQPHSADEYVEQGASDEESGDRWFGSDITKAIRFYQKAYEQYTAGLSLSSGLHADAYYNAARLLFHVYNHYVSAEEVNTATLENVGDATSGSETSVCQSITAVFKAHEQAMSVAGDSPSPDLVYNFALVHIAMLEDEDNGLGETVRIGNSAIGLLEQVLNWQVSALREFAQEVAGLENPTLEATFSDRASVQEKQKSEEHTSEQVLQPDDVLETVISGYKLALAMMDGLAISEIAAVAATVGPLLDYCDTIAAELMAGFNENTNAWPDLISSISPQTYHEYEVNRAYFRSYNHMESPSAYIAFWNDILLPKIPERYMVAADGLAQLIEAHRLTVHASDPEQISAVWRCLSQMSLYYKAAQDLLQAQYQQKARGPSGINDGIGSLIAQVSKVIIARADIEVQRSQLELDAARKSQELLIKNAKTLLRNAMSMAEATGGLRERAIEKLQREKRKSEIVFRLCLLEQKTSVAELDSILGRERWVPEFQAVRELRFYSKWGVDEIRP